MYVLISFFFFNDTATTEIYTLSLHDALPIFVPLVKNQSDVMRFRKDLGVALAQLLQYLAEFHGVGPVAGVGFVKQGDMIIAADQQHQTDLSQIDAASLVLDAPGEPGSGTSVDVGDEVGGVVDQGGGVDAPIAHQHLRDFLLDGLDGFERKFSHVVEKEIGRASCRERV